MSLVSPVTFASVGRLEPSMPLRYLAVAALPLGAAVALAVVGAFGSYVAMGLPLRLFHFCATAIVIGAPAFAVSAALRRYVFNNAPPLWAAILTAVTLAPAGGLVVQYSLRLCAPRVLPYVSFGELTAQVLLVNLIVGTLDALAANRQM